MTKELLCIVCPTGCHLQAERVGDDIQVTGQGCKRGVAFAKAEMTHPMRSLTTTVRTAFAGVPALPVRTEGEIPKEKIPEALLALSRLVVRERLGCGAVVLPDVAGSGYAVIITSNQLMETEEA